MRHPYLAYPASASCGQIDGPLDPPPEPPRYCRLKGCGARLTEDETDYCEGCLEVLREEEDQSDIAVLLRFHNEGK